MKKLFRPTSGRMICGVCAGFGLYFNIAPALVRVIFAIAGLTGSGLLIYLACAFIMPDDMNVEL